MRSSRPVAALLLLGLAAHAQRSAVLHVYGPGGPAPAIEETAAVFGKQEGIAIKVTPGPTRNWEADLPSEGDILYSGLEAMMSDFIGKFTDALVPSTVQPLYLRPAGILVRPGNPKHIAGFLDLLRPGIKIMVVNGAGQVGLWED